MDKTLVFSSLGEIGFGLAIYTFVVFRAVLKFVVQMVLYCFEYRLFSSNDPTVRNFVGSRFDHDG